MAWIDGAKRESGGASAAWGGRFFTGDYEDNQTSHLVFKSGNILNYDSVTPFGAELLALEGATEAALSCIPRGSYQASINLF